MVNNMYKYEKKMAGPSIAVLLASKVKKPKEMEEEETEVEDSETSDFEDIAEEVLSAIEEKDAVALAKCLKLLLSMGE